MPILYYGVNKHFFSVSYVILSKIHSQLARTTSTTYHSISSVIMHICVMNRSAYKQDKRQPTPIANHLTHRVSNTQHRRHAWTYGVRVTGVNNHLYSHRTYTSIRDQSSQSSEGPPRLVPMQALSSEDPLKRSPKQVRIFEIDEKSESSDDR